MEELTDLHVHSTCSDGTFSPEELVFYAQKKGLRAFALTDHDTTAGIRRAQKAAEGTSLTVIPGIELSTEYLGSDVHILGLGIHPEAPAFRAYLEDFRRSRDLRNDRMMEKLKSAGISISREAMQEEFPDCVWTRAHFALYLKKHGYVKEMQDAFNRYIGDRAPCYVPREGITPSGAVKLVLSGGGHPVLAHPVLCRFGRERLEQLVTELKAAGLQGLEAIYSANRGCDESAMKLLARRHGLAVTGGSDFHGTNKKDIDLGCGKGNLRIPFRLWEELSARPVTPPACC